MYIPANLLYEFYLPNELEIGMLFINVLYPGTDREYVDFWELEELPEDVNDFYEKNGLPVTIFLGIPNDEDYEDDFIELADQRPWFEDDDDTNESLTLVNLTHLNKIYQRYAGIVGLLIDDEEYEENNLILPIYEQGKVILSYLEFDEEDDEDTE